MSTSSKHTLSGIVSVACVVFIVLCMGRVIPAGLAGDIATVKVFFWLMALVVVIGIASAMAYYYYGGKSDDHEDLSRMGIEINTLAQAAQKPANPAPTASQHPQPGSEKGIPKSGASAP